MVPTWLDFGIQNPSKSHQNSILEGIIFLIDFGIDFFSILIRFWKPTWSDVGSFSAKHRPRGPKKREEKARKRHQRTQTPPRRLQTSILERFWMDFGSILIDFWMTFWLIFKIYIGEKRLNQRKQNDNIR